MVKEWLSSKKFLIFCLAIVMICNIYLLFMGELLAITCIIFVSLCLYQDYIIFCYNWEEEHPLESLTMKLKEFNDFLEEQNKKLEEENEKNKKE